MPPQPIFCPGGTSSQSGTAVKERYPGAPIETCGDKIPDALSMSETHNGPFVIPIWNSHAGEVKAAAYVWDSIQDAKIKITDAWVKTIEFWFVRRVGAQTAHGKIGSVVVAGTQCSGFFQQKKATLEKCDLTTVAFDKYREGAAWDGVLVAPGQGESEAGFEVVSKQTANPNNFTSFVRFVPSRAFAVNRAEISSWLTGVRMRAFGASMGDAEQTFFDELLGLVKDLKDTPKLVFVFNRDAKVGLLFEGMELHAGDLLDAEQLEIDEISIYENAGATEKLYTQELNSFFNQKFPALNQDDFLLHIGVSTCLFACPPLGLYTHGYQVETVEPVVRFYIDKLFQLWDDGGLKCTPAQTEFFQRHKGAWIEKRSEFIKFKSVSATEV